MVRGYHSSSQAAVTSSTSRRPVVPGHLDHGMGLVDLGDDDELESLTGGQVPPGQVEVGLVPREDHPGAVPRGGCAARARSPG